MPRPWRRWLAARSSGVGIDNGGGIGDGIGDAGDNDIMADNEEEDDKATKTKVIVNKRKQPRIFFRTFRTFPTRSAMSSTSKSTNISRGCIPS